MFFFMGAKIDVTARLVVRMRAEYQAMPGLKLTPEQACRLWSVDIESCDAAFDILLAEGLLHKTGTGKYIALSRPASTFASAMAAPDVASAQVRCPNCFKLNTIQQQRDGQDHVVATTFRCTACQRIVSIAPISA